MRDQFQCVANILLVVPKQQPPLRVKLSRNLFFVKVDFSIQKCTTINLRDGNFVDYFRPNSNSLPVIGIKYDYRYMYVYKYSRFAI